MTKLTSFVKHSQSVCGIEGERLNNEVKTIYNNAEWATGVVTNYDVKTNQNSMFNNISIARFISIRTDAGITVKFNEDSNDGITIAANTTFNIDILEITNIFITAAQNANVKIFLI